MLASRLVAEEIKAHASVRLRVDELSATVMSVGVCVRSNEKDLVTRSVTEVYFLFRSLALHVDVLLQAMCTTYVPACGARSSEFCIPLASTSSRFDRKARAWDRATSSRGWLCVSVQFFLARRGGAHGWVSGAVDAHHSRPSQRRQPRALRHASKSLNQPEASRPTLTSSTTVAYRRDSATLARTRVVLLARRAHRVDEQCGPLFSCIRPIASVGRFDMKNYRATGVLIWTAIPSGAIEQFSESCILGVDAYLTVCLVMQCA